MATPSKSWLQRFKESESSTSIIFGAIVVIIVGILLFNYSRTATTPSISNSGEATESAAITAPNGITLPATHQVTSGETLWSIANQYYGNGEKWSEIAAENKLSNSGTIEVGQTLNIPLEKTSASGKSYAVNKGDSLWNIAKATYGDGMRWTEIYQANINLITNPNLIYPGQTLVLP